MSAFRQKQEEKAYKIYVTDALKVIANNTAGGEARYMIQRRWVELLEPVESEEAEQDPRSCEEIAADIWKRIRGKKK